MPIKKVLSLVGTIVLVILWNDINIKNVEHHGSFSISIQPILLPKLLWKCNMWVFNFLTDRAWASPWKILNSPGNHKKKTKQKKNPTNQRLHIQITHTKWNGEGGKDRDRSEKSVNARVFPISKYDKDYSEPMPSVQACLTPIFCPSPCLSALCFFLWIVSQNCCAMPSPSLPTHSWVTRPPVTENKTSEVPKKSSLVLIVDSMVSNEMNYCMY